MVDAKVKKKKLYIISTVPVSWEASVLTFSISAAVVVELAKALAGRTTHDDLHLPLAGPFPPLHNTLQQVAAVL
jgi:hypothetical protein